MERKLTAEEVKFIEDNIGLMYSTVGRLSRQNYSSNRYYLDHEELVDIAFDGMVRSIRTYDKKRSKFSTYYNLIVERLVYSECRKRRGRLTSRPVLLREGEDLDISVDDDSYYFIDTKLSLTDRQNKIVELKLAGYIDEDIAKELGVSRRTILRDLVAIKEVLRGD